MLSRCTKFPKEKKLKKYISEVTEAVIAGSKNLESLSKAEQADSKAKIELFGFLPPKTKKSILLQASGGQGHPELSNLTLHLAAASSDHHLPGDDREVDCMSIYVLGVIV